jgi:hypothetical protein
MVIVTSSVLTAQASKTFYDNKEDFLQLWVHETFRIIGDRMWDPTDVAWLRKQLDERLSSTFGVSFPSLFEEFNEQVCLLLLCSIYGTYWCLLAPLPPCCSCAHSKASVLGRSQYSSEIDTALHVVKGVHPSYAAGASCRCLPLSTSCAPTWTCRHTSLCVTFQL